MIDHIKVGLLNATGIEKSPEKIIEFCNNNVDLIPIAETSHIREQFSTECTGSSTVTMQYNLIEKGENKAVYIYSTVQL